MTCESWGAVAGVVEKQVLTGAIHTGIPRTVIDVMLAHRALVASHAVTVIVIVTVHAGGTILTRLISTLIDVLTGQALS